MRKSIVMGFVAGVLVLAGAVVLLALRPWESTVEYHIKGYREAEWRISGNQTWLDRILGRPKPRPTVIKIPVPKDPFVRKAKHEKALLDLGYLEKREFHLTNTTVLPIACEALARMARRELPGDRLWRIGRDPNASNVFILQVERHDMAKWEEMVRRIDVPPGAK